MSFLKTVLFLLFSTFLAYRSWELFAFLISENGLSLVVVFICTFLLNLFITGVFAFPSFVLPLYRVLPSKYYRIKHPKRVQFLFKLFGASLYKHLLIVFFWGRAENKRNFFSGSKSGLENLVIRSKQAEAGHLLPALIISFLSFVLLLNGHLDYFLFTMLINILGNFYPILLQRALRIRTQSLLKK